MNEGQMTLEEGASLTMKLHLLGTSYAYTLETRMCHCRKVNLTDQLQSQNRLSHVQRLPKVTIEWTTRLTAKLLAFSYVQVFLAY
jgi:hypothetical protein